MKHTSYSFLLILLLSWIAGFVDVTGYLSLFKVFTANMSGNTVAFGALIAQNQYAEAWRRFTPIPWFVAGVVIGAAIMRILNKSGKQSGFSAVFGVEAILIAAFMILTTVLNVHNISLMKFFPLLILFPSLAMGLQSATLRSFDGEPVRTTFVTGMLTSFGHEIAAFLSWSFDQFRVNRFRFVKNNICQNLHALRRTILSVSIWSCYLLGALMGGWLWIVWGILCLILPLTGLIAAIILEHFHKKTINAKAFQ